MGHGALQKVLHFPLFFDVLMWLTTCGTFHLLYRLNLVLLRYASPHRGTGKQSLVKYDEVSILKVMDRMYSFLFSETQSVARELHSEMISGFTGVLSTSTIEFPSKMCPLSFKPFLYLFLKTLALCLV